FIGGSSPGDVAPALTAPASALRASVSMAPGATILECFATRNVLRRIATDAAGISHRWGDSALPASAYDESAARCEVMEARLRSPTVPPACSRVRTRLVAAIRGLMAAAEELARSGRRPNSSERARERWGDALARSRRAAGENDRHTLHACTSGRS